MTSSNCYYTDGGILDDRWNADPSQVTSFISFLSSQTSDLFPKSRTTSQHVSPNCGLGWHFEVTESRSWKTSSPTATQAQESDDQVTVSYKPPVVLSVLPPRNVTFHVKVTYPANPATQISPEQKFNDVSLKTGFKLGSYKMPVNYEGRVVIVIAVTFNPLDGLSLPNPPSVNLQTALSQSLDDPGFIDTKFYLYSGRKGGIPVRPKVLFAKSQLLMEGSPYIRDVLSSGVGFGTGTPCNLRGETPVELTKLSPDAYDYDSDSDLESLPDDEGDSSEEVREPVETSQDVAFSDKEEEEQGPSSSDSEPSRKKPATVGYAGSPISAGAIDGRAFAINGTAYQTWKALIFYAYSKNISFNSLKSYDIQDIGPLEPTMIRCSPKSMYRLADTVNLPKLKTLAKEGIRRYLTRSNIVTELFSPFTYRYQEIIEMEVDYFLHEYDPHQLGKQVDSMLQLVASGEKPHCHRVLAFLMRRLSAQSSKDAWRFLDHAAPEPDPRTPTSETPTPPEMSNQAPTAKTPSNIARSTGIAPLSTPLAVASPQTPQTTTPPLPVPQPAQPPASLKLLVNLPRESNSVTRTPSNPFSVAIPTDSLSARASPTPSSRRRIVPLPRRG